MINFYVDPGSGFVFVQNTSLVWAVILGILGSFFIFFKLFFKLFKKLFFLFLILIIIWGGIIIMNRPVIKKKLIILGIDAMDPLITEQLMDNGKLPNLDHLRRKGFYSHLKTTNPSESVVVWTSFFTGLNPGGHGIFDFIMREPQTYLPYLSLNEISNRRPNPEIIVRRKGKTVWEVLTKNKIPSYLYFCPNTFPPDIIMGKMLSGMGVPDITGTLGRFTFYSTKALSEKDSNSRGRIIHVQSVNFQIPTEIFGPKVFSSGPETEAKIPLKITLIPDRDQVLLEFQRQRFYLKTNSWSGWYSLSFKNGLFSTIDGIVRFYLKSIKPDFELYASPINFNPEKPLFSISYPKDFSNKLAKKLGFYYTQGMPADTWVISEDRLDEKAFLEHVDDILLEREKILKDQLKEFKGGLFFFYIDTLDVIQHMFWRYMEAGTSFYEKDSIYRDTIFRYYQKIDSLIGEILNNLAQDTTLIVLSDHGFNAFHKAVHLNRWLLDNNYLFLKDGVAESKELFERVDWSKTKAYALGFGGIYMNKVGREYYGIVNYSEVTDLKQEIIKGLEQLRDPETQEPVVNKVYDQKDIFDGPYTYNAPDLFVGFNRGFRASWQTALGGVPGVLIEENIRKWSGDHLIDPAFVPGVIFMNKDTGMRNPAITDIAPAIFKYFDLSESLKESSNNTF